MVVLVDNDERTYQLEIDGKLVNVGGGAAFLEVRIVVANTRRDLLVEARLDQFATLFRADRSSRPENLLQPAGGIDGQPHLAGGVTNQSLEPAQQRSKAISVIEPRIGSGLEDPRFAKQPIEMQAATAVHSHRRHETRQASPMEDFDHLLDGLGQVGALVAGPEEVDIEPNAGCTERQAAFPAAQSVLRSVIAISEAHADACVHRVRGDLTGGRLKCEQ